MLPGNCLPRGPTCACWCDPRAGLTTSPTSQPSALSAIFAISIRCRKGMAGCEFVFHVAADYRLWSRNGQELYDSNVEGTRNILQAARDSGVRRVIYTSSVATMGFGNNGRLTDEKSPVTLSNMIGDYKRSKFMAEQLVIEAGRSGQERSDGESHDAGRRARHQADAERTNRGGLPAAQVSSVCRYGPEPGRRCRLRRGTPAGDGKGAARRALHSRRRESDAEADP